MNNVRHEHCRKCITSHHLIYHPHIFHIFTGTNTKLKTKAYFFLLDGLLGSVYNTNATNETTSLHNITIQPKQLKQCIQSASKIDPEQ